MADDATRIVDVQQATCWTCSRSFFGGGGARTARDHARLTGHQVTVVELVRETINMPAAERPLDGLRVFDADRGPQPEVEPYDG